MSREKVELFNEIKFQMVFVGNREKMAIEMDDLPKIRFIVNGLAKEIEGLKVEIDELKQHPFISKVLHLIDENKKLKEDFERFKAIYRPDDLPEEGN
ncbi:MAG: hypothetical protein WC389_20040 [Lutibacter sp.]|jgi:methyl coenzyme M reductase subunit C-like uncharacterized protein (methanogenesis marker protein 7)